MALRSRRAGHRSFRYRTTKRLMLSAYRQMWALVMFDLPVGSADERKAATGFRLVLLDLGFEMVQFSVYARYCTSPQRTETLVRQVEEALPTDGAVDILFFTDKQYENVKHFRGKQRLPATKTPTQFDLF